MVLSSLLTASHALSGELTALAERVRPSVVEIRSDRGGGAGVIWSPDGRIVTNHHVVPGDRARVVLADGRSFDATVERRDADQDLAVLRVQATDLPAATIGDSLAVRVGQLVIAIGNPLGVPRVVTVGIISGPTEGSNGRLRWRDAIQSEIELRPGNSGGPLLDASGHVIAINSMVIGPRMALSVPAHTVAALLTAHAQTLYLGVTVQPIPLPATWAAAAGGQQEALLVTSIAEKSPADVSGLLPGDVLLGLDYLAATPTTAPSLHKTLIDPGDLAWSLAQARHGAPITLHLLRGGQPIRQQMTPGLRG
jgi:serine protease Do